MSVEKGESECFTKIHEENNDENSEKVDQKSRVTNLSLAKSLPSAEGSKKHEKRFSLQRPPSHISIRENIQRQNTNDETPPNTQNQEYDNLPINIEPNPNLSVCLDSVHRINEENLSNDQSQILLTSTTDPAAEETGQCIECVKAIPVFSAEEVDIGDHITFAGAIYDHHAIVVEKNSDLSLEVIEATNTFSGVVVSFTKFLGQKARLVSSRKTFDFAKQKIHIIFYKKRRFSKFETVQRAKRCLEDGDLEVGLSAKYKYHLFDNNCEHFATYCVTGEKFSIQVTKFRLTGRLFLSSGFLGISDEKKRNEKEFENKIICKECFEMNQKLLDVPVRKIEKREDVIKGDIIRYSYWNLWHEAVVLEIAEVKNDCVKCFIAHYAFCGPFSHRTIKKELVTINFNGQYKKLDYKPPQFHVYDPETVVHRAERRLGEQMFVFFSNDSSHYARWCKLKLELQFDCM